MVTSTLDLNATCLTGSFSRFKTAPFNSLPNDKILNRSKSKAFADDKINVYQKLKFVLRWVENNLGKGENVVRSIFSFPKKFSKALFLRVIKSQDYVVNSLTIKVHFTFCHPAMPK